MEKLKLVIQPCGMAELIQQGKPCGIDFFIQQGRPNRPWLNRLATARHSTGQVMFNLLSSEAYSTRLRIYNYALTAEQVKALYNEGSAVRFGPSSGSP